MIPAANIMVTALREVQSMKALKKITACLLAGVMFTTWLAGTAFAETNYTKYITSISIKTVCKVVAGDSISANDIGKTADATADVMIYAQDSAKYYVESVEVDNEGETLKVGDQVKVKVYVTVKEDIQSPYDYQFKGSFNSSNVSLSGGATFVSASRTSDCVTVTLRLKAVGGQYEEPMDAYWNNTKGSARWMAPDSTSGYYDITLMRNGNNVHTVEAYKGVSYNLFPWMTKEGEYTFKVRTVPKPDSSQTIGKKSEWVECNDSVYLDKNHVSDGSGQGGDPGSSVTAGWVQKNGNWYYYFPDGTCRKNGWEKIMGKWYLFGSSGEMLTGWQTVNNNTYYMNGTGDMKTGWIENQGQWYFLNPNPLAGVEGAMVKNAWVDDAGQRYYLTASGAMATGWVKIGEKFYYFNPQAGGPKGAMARNTYIETFYVGADGAWIENR